MTSIIDIVVQWAVGLIGDWSLPAVFVLMLLESASIPVPTEAIMPFAGFAVTMGGRLGIRLGAQREDLRPYPHHADYVVVAAPAAIVVWAFLKWSKGSRFGGPGPAECGDEA